MSSFLNSFFGAKPPVSQPKNTAEPELYILGKSATTTQSAYKREMRMLGVLGEAADADLTAAPVNALSDDDQAAALALNLFGSASPATVTDENNSLFRTESKRPAKPLQHANGQQTLADFASGDPLGYFAAANDDAAASIFGFFEASAPSQASTAAQSQYGIGVWSGARLTTVAVTRAQSAAVSRKISGAAINTLYSSHYHGKYNAKSQLRKVLGSVPAS